MYNKFKILMTSSFLKNSYYTILGNVIYRGSTLLGMILLARNLGADLYGEIGVITASLLLVAPLGSLGVGYSINKILASKKYSNIISTIVMTAIIITIVFGSLTSALFQIFGDKLLEMMYPNQNNDNNVLFLAAFYLLLIIIINTLTGIYSGLHKFKTLSFYQIQTGILSIPLYYYLSYYGEVQGTYLAFILTQFFFLMLLFYGIREYFNATSKKYLKNIHRFALLIIRQGLPLGFADGIYAITNWLMIVILLLRGGSSEVGLYNAASQWLMLIVFLPSSLSNVLLAFLSKNKVLNMNNSSTLLKNNILFQSIFALILTTSIISMSEFIAKIYGSEFDEINSIILILTLSSLPIILTGVLFQSFISSNKSNYVFIIRLLSQLVLLILTYGLLVNVNAAFDLAIYKLISSTVALLFAITLYLKMIGRFNNAS